MSSVWRAWIQDLYDGMDEYQGLQLIVECSFFDPADAQPRLTEILLSIATNSSSSHQAQEQVEEEEQEEEEEEDEEDDIVSLQIRDTLGIDSILPMVLKAVHDAFPRIQHIDMTRALNGELPSELGLYAGLTRIVASQCRIDRLSGAVFGSLPALKDNEITELPEAIFQHLSMLSRLNISDNPISMIPDTLCLLPSLTSLKMNGTEVEELPRSIGRLSALTVLEAAATGLNCLPESIGALKRLNELDCRTNAISMIVPSFCQLESLTMLNLSRNVLTQLPANIGELSCLISLDLSSNLIEFLPASMCDMESLQQLSIRSNRLESLPDRIGALADLRALDASYNGIQSIPESIAWCHSLSQANLSYNVIEQAPTFLPRSLVSLDLDCNLLTSVPVNYAWSPARVSINGCPISSHEGSSNLIASRVNSVLTFIYPGDNHDNSDFVSLALGLPESLAVPRLEQLVLCYIVAQLYSGSYQALSDPSLFLVRRILESNRVTGACFSCRAWPVLDGVVVTLLRPDSNVHIVYCSARCFLRHAGRKSDPDAPH